MRWANAVIGVGILCCAASWGDSIKIGDQVYDGVYITEGESTYYICVPSDGSVFNADKSEVDEKNVTITPEREARRALYQEWAKKNGERKGQTSVESASQVPEQSAPAVKTDSAKSADDPTPKKRGRRFSGPTISAEGTYGAYAQQDTQRMAQERNIDALRQRREADKVRLLTQRRVITSNDGRGKSVNWNSGGFSGGGGGGLGGGGYGGSGGGGWGGNGGNGGNWGGNGRF